MSDRIFGLTPKDGARINLMDVANGYTASKLNFNEADAMRIVYGKGAQGQRGEVTGEVYPLVSRTFEVLVSGATREQLIQRAEALFEAVSNPEGGLLDFKPAGVAAGVMTTYYEYLQSNPPEPKSTRWWDVSPSGDGTYAAEFTVSLQTNPIAVSDKDNPIVVRSLTEVANLGTVDIPAATLKGSMPALVRLRGRNMQGADCHKLEKVVLFRRTEGLTDFAAVYNALDAANVAPTTSWLDQSDESRQGDGYKQCILSESGNGVAQRLRFTIPNWASHKGRCAVIGVVRSGSASVDVWAIRSEIAMGQTVVEAAPDREVEYLAPIEGSGLWHYTVLGEFEIPPLSESDDESFSLYVDVVATRRTGTSQFDVDCIILLFVDECALECVTELGFSSSEALLIENFERELAHVINASSSGFVTFAETHGAYITLKPGVDNRLFFLLQRVGGGLGFEDGFTSYEVGYYRLVADMEEGEFETGGEVLKNWSFEEWPDGPLDVEPTNWDKVSILYTGTATNNRESVIVHEGDHALRIEFSDLEEPDIFGVIQEILSELTPGVTYLLTVRVKNASIPYGNIKVYAYGNVSGESFAVNEGAAHAEYTKHMVEFSPTAEDTSFYIRVEIWGGGGACSGTIYIDAVSVKEAALVGWTFYGTGSLERDTTYFVEGQKSLHLHQDGAVSDDCYARGVLPAPIDLENDPRFQSEDFCVISLYLTEDSWDELDASGLTLTFVTDTDTWTGLGVSWAKSALRPGWNYLRREKNEFSGSGWGSVEGIQFGRGSWTHASGFDCYIDDIRLVKAIGCAGESWRFLYPVRWGIHGENRPELVGFGPETNVPQLSLSVEDEWQDVVIRGDMRLKRDEGYMGLAIRAGGEVDNEYGYLFMLDSLSDKLRTFRLLDGQRESIYVAVDVPCRKETWYSIGARVRGTELQCFVSPTPSTLFSPANCKARVRDSSASAIKTGYVGVAGFDTGLVVVRGFYASTSQDLVVPSDRLEIQAEGVYRSIYPFSES